ncbi:hypothetical protein [uncultured Paraglaciecola sp.]|uniref:phage baseplate plug family protein n=1 Tax=uncultured Paraglaciecola sp. TaxID=1765024 RepID=UPI002613541E|nr:hypothetical protein [uncultured Paraglaciecola sp.]
MRYINRITENSNQRFILTGIDGIRIEARLRFMPRIRRWMLDVIYNDVCIKGVPVCNSLNMLRQYRDQIPFGISCISIDGIDPFRIDDFKTTRSSLFLLDESDVEQVEVDWFE